MNIKYLMRKVIHTERSDSDIVTYIQNRTTKENRNFLATVTGATGAGKSWGCLTLCNEIDPFFTVDRIVFNVNDLINQVGKGYPAGSCFIFEEAQVSAHNLNFWDVSNKNLTYLLSTFRSNRYVVFFTLPDEELMNSQSRKLVHAIFNATGNVDYKNKMNYFKIFFPKRDFYKKDKVYYNNMEKDTADGRVACRGAWIEKPPQILIDAYENKKRLFQNKLQIQMANSYAMDLTKKKNKDLKMLGKVIPKEIDV